MNRELQTQIHNRFDIEVIDAKTGKVKEKAQAFNVICSQLWDCLLGPTYRNYAAYIHYGSGTGTPSVSDTSLFTFEGYIQTTASGSSENHKTGVISNTRYVQIGAATAVGITLTEVGLAYGTQSGNLVTHAMLQDMNGNPISIAKTDTDIINIYSTMYLHWNINSPDFKLCKGGFTDALLGVSTTNLGSLQICIATSNCVIYSPFNGAITAGNASKSVDIANKRVTFTSPRLAAGSGNTASAKYICLNSALSGVLINASQNTWQTHISGESVGVGDGTTVKFKTKFSFPENATISINGNPITTGVTVKKLPVYTTEWRQDQTGQSPRITFMSISPDSEDDDFIYVPASANHYYNSNSWELPNVILYNPLYTEGEGLYSVLTNNFGKPNRLEASNDLENWVTILSSFESYNDTVIPAQYRASKYFRFIPNSTACLNNMRQTQDGYNIIFDTPPANGDVITIDYDTECIAKDSDHVLDTTLTISMAEWSGE